MSESDLGSTPRTTEAAVVPVTAILVTHNSQAVLARAVRCLQSGAEVPHRIVVVDSGSEDPSYLDGLVFDESEGQVLMAAGNVGFCVGNNLGLGASDGDDDVLLLNPDAFVSPEFLLESRRYLATHPDVGAVGPKLTGFDLATDQPTGLIDSAGIGQSGWGRFFDRGQGRPDQGQYDDPVDAVALCGAAILLRRSALADALVAGQLFDPAFFMYKEDIDLSIRLQRAGWRTVYLGQTTVQHCRGWNPDRALMPRWTKRQSLANEWRLWRRGWTPQQSRWRALPYLVAKTAAVRLGA